VIRCEERSSQDVVELRGPFAGPARIRDAVLIDDDRRPTTEREPEEGPE